MRTLFTLLFVAFLANFISAQNCIVDKTSGENRGALIQPNTEYTFEYEYRPNRFTTTTGNATWVINGLGDAEVKSRSVNNSTPSPTFTVTILTGTEQAILNFLVEATGSDAACTAVIESDLTVLPVELTAFNAEGTTEGVNVTWETASELNNDYFTVERSFDGTNFEAIGKVYGAGNSTVKRNYSFVDNSEELATTNVAYYRLTQTDFDGKTETLDVAEVKLQQAEKLAINNVTVESDNLVRIDFSALANQEATIEMYDMTGRILGTSVVEAHEGVNTVELGTISMQGMAVVRISTTTGSAVRKFVVR